MVSLKLSMRVLEGIASRVKGKQSIFTRGMDVLRQVAARGRVLLIHWNTHFHHIQSQVLIWIKEASGYRPVRFFRNYAALGLVIACALMVAGTNISQGTVIMREVADYFEVRQGVVAVRPSAQATHTRSLSMVPLAEPVKTLDPDAPHEDTSVIASAVLSPENQMFLAAAVGSGIARDPEEEGGVKIYTVAEGDTVSAIAARFDITVNTILWANDLDNVDAIRPGDQIFILPVAGFNYVVKTGDSIDAIASKYHASREQIIAFNGLPANGELTVGESVTIPGGVKETPTPGNGNSSGLTRRQYASPGSLGGALDITPDFTRPKEGRAGSGHRFPYGYCTWYVAQKRYVPWGGNAGTWLYNARASGYRTGKTPAVGSIVVTTENRYYGHVALVERVTGDVITVSEMNYIGWSKKSVRQLSRSSRVIKGYIY